MAKELLNLLEDALKALVESQQSYPDGFESTYNSSSASLARALQPFAHSILQRLNACIDAIKKRPVLRREFGSDANSLFTSLTKGLKSSIEAIRHRVLAGQNLPVDIPDTSLPDLHNWLAFQNEVLYLLTEYVRLQSLGHDLNTQAELEKINVELENAKISLQDQLCNLFDCDPSHILPPQSDTHASRRGSGSLGHSVRVSELLLKRLQNEGKKMSQRFPHDTDINTLIEMIAYWFSKVQTQMVTHAENFSEEVGGQIYIDILKSCWLAHCTRKHEELRGKAPNVSNIVCISAKRAVSIFRQFKSLDRNKYPIPPSEEFLEGRYNFCINVPPQAIQEDHMSHETSGSSQVVHVSTSSGSGTEFMFPIPKANDGEFELHNIESPYQGRGSTLGFTTDIEVVRREATPVPSNYISCSVHIFKKPAADASFRLCTSVPNSAVPIEYQTYDSELEPRLTQLIPAYAFNESCREIWFRRGNEACGPRLRFKAGSTQVFAFQDIFTTDIWINAFTSIREVKFYTSHHRKTLMTNACAQVWEEPCVRTPISAQVISPNSPTGATSSSRRTPSRSEAFETEYSPNKFVIYANYSIYTLYLTEKLQCKVRDEKKVELTAVNGDSIPVCVISGTQASPAGIPLGGKTAFYSNEPDFKTYYQIRFTFSDLESLKGFEKEFASSQKEWKKNRHNNINQRMLQRQPVVRPHSDWRFPHEHDPG